MNRTASVGWLKPHVFYQRGYWWCMTYVTNLRFRVGVGFTIIEAWFMWEVQPQHISADDLEL